MKTEQEIRNEIKGIENRKQEFIDEMDECEKDDDYRAQIQLYDELIEKLEWVLE